MCGIAGIVDFAQPVSPAVLTQMRDVLAHRGPDGAGLWLAPAGTPSVGLAHRRLAILDRSAAGHQPMISADGQTVLIFNGEIYNYRELAVELLRLGHSLRGNSDTEVLLAAYEAWGPACLERFNGMWAFALWDQRRRQLFAARDRLGKKPFYYFWDGQRLVFASEMKALFQHPLIPCRPDAEAVDRYCRSFSLDGVEKTMFEHIEQLPPAHHLTLDDRGSLSVSRYWAINPAARIDLPSVGDYVARFRELFADAVKLRLRADVPVGSSLSGGLDSSLIVGVVADFRRRGLAATPQRTFSARFDDRPIFDEGPFIDSVVAHTGVEAHGTTPDPDELLAEIGRLHYHQEEPFLSSSIFAQWEVMRLARRQQTIVLLDGQGSDELLGGYLPYVGYHLCDLAARGAWRSAWHEYRRFSAQQQALAHRYGDVALRTGDLSLSKIFSKATRLLTARLTRGMHGERKSTSDVVGGDRLGRQLHADLTRDSIPMLLRYSDRNSMAFGVEVRNPFLDHRLVEFLMQVPGDLKIRDGWTKFLLRESAVGLMPEVVRRRTDKVGFITPEDEWLRGPLRSWAEGVLLGSRLRQLPGYPLERVKRQWHAHQSGRRHLRGQLWPWLSLHQWLDMTDRGVLSRGPAQARAA